MNRSFKAAALGATALAAGVVTTGAMAQAPDVITVTAQKREQTLQETPVSVAVVTDEAIQQSQVRDAADLQTLVPSLRVAEFASSTNTEFALRGIGTSSFNAGLEPSVGVFVDGVYRPRSGAAINDLLSVERVEVIRGPQSTLFGRNTPAGVVSFITKEPEFEFGGDAELTVGNYDTLIAKGTLTGPLNEAETLAFRLDATTHTNSGFLDNSDGREINNRDRQSYRGQLMWLPNDRTEVRLIADYGEIDEACCAATFANYDPVDLQALVPLGATINPSPRPFADEVAIDGPVRSLVENAGISAEVNVDFDAFTFTSITAYRDYDESSDIDADFTDVDLVAEREIGQEYTSFTQEFRLTSNGGNFVDWMVGAFYYDNDLVSTETRVLGGDARSFFDLASASDPVVSALAAEFGLPPGAGAPTVLEAFLDLNNAFGVGQSLPTPSGNPIPTPPAPNSAGVRYLQPGDGLVLQEFDYDTDAFSAFAQFDVNFTDRLTLKLGGRYSHEEKTLAADVNIDEDLSQIDFVNLARDLRFIDPANPAATCDPAAFALVGGDACAFAVPALLQQSFFDELVAQGVNPFDPANAAIVQAAAQPFLSAGFNILDPNLAQTPLTLDQARDPLLNPLLAFTQLQNFVIGQGVPANQSRTDENFSYSAILSYDVSDTLNVYASYSTGFKPGGFNVSFEAARTGVFEFEDETASSIEIGAKGSLFDRTFNYAIAVFDQEIEDFQSNNFVGNGFALENAGSIEVAGVELETSWAPTDRLFFTFGGTWLFKDEYGEYPFAPCPDRGPAVPALGSDGLVFDPSDPKFALCVPGAERENEFGVRGLFNDLSGVDRGNSELVGSATGTYTQPVGNNLEMFLRGEARYTSEFFHTTTLDPRPFARQDDFWLYNASVGLGAADGAWQVMVWGRNLADEDYTKGGFPTVGQLGTSYNIYPGDPRTYGVTLRASF